MRNVLLPSQVLTCLLTPFCSKKRSKNPLDHALHCVLFLFLTWFSSLSPNNQHLPTPKRAHCLVYWTNIKHYTVGKKTPKLSGNKNGPIPPTQDLLCPAHCHSGGIRPVTAPGMDVTLRSTKYSGIHGANKYRALFLSRINN